MRGDVLDGQCIAISGELDFLAHITSTEDDASGVLDERGQVLDGECGILCAGRQGGGRHFEAVSGCDADVSRQVGSCDVERGAGAGPLDEQRVNRRRDGGECRCIGTRGIDGEIVDVGTKVLEADLLRGNTAHARQLDIVDA